MKVFGHVQGKKRWTLSKLKRNTKDSGKHPKRQLGKSLNQDLDREQQILSSEGREQGYKDLKLNECSSCDNTKL